MDRKTFLKHLTGGAAALAITPALSRGGHGGSHGNLIPGLDKLDTSNWDSIRNLFPLTRDRIYFNTGGLGPTSYPVLEAFKEQLLKQAEAGETYHGIFEDIREITAQFAGAKANEIAFVRNASEGNSIIAAGLDLKAGDEVIFESHAHPGGSFPWLTRQKEDGIKVRIFEPDSEKPENNLDRIFALVNDRTRVIQVSHLTAPTGILFDVRSIAKEARKRGIWFHIDGAQSAGMIPLNLRQIGCDSYATSGHKWMNGPQETGFLYIAKERIEEVPCSHAGAYSGNDYSLPDKFEYIDRAQRHEYGTRDAASLLGFATAIGLQEKIGRKRIAAHGKKLVELSRERLGTIDGLEILTPEHPGMYNSIFTFRLQGHTNKEVNRALTNDYKLRCREVSERNLNAVRISWHVYNTVADLDQLEMAIRRILETA